MDRTAWIAIILSIIGLVWWNHDFTQKQAERAAELRKLQNATPEQVAGAAPQPTSPATVNPLAPTPVTAKPPEVTIGSREPEQTLVRANRANTMEYVFSSRGGISKISLLQHKGEGEAHVMINANGSFPIGATFDESFANPGSFSIREEASELVVLEQTKESLILKKVFRLAPSEPVLDPYVTELDIEWINTGSSPLQIPPQYISVGEISPIHKSDQIIYTGMDYFREGSPIHTPVTWFDHSTIPFTNIETRAAEQFFVKNETAISWVGVRNQFFTSIITDREKKSDGVWSHRLGLGNFNGQPVYGIEGAIRNPGFVLTGNQTVKRTFQIYTGPRELSRLQKLKQSEAEIMNYGPFKLVSGILLASMIWLKGLLGNYATAILVLTIIIKLILYPLQNSATQQMKRMSQLSPKMTELKEKYKDNPQRMNEEVMKLYKEYGVNPFAGCLPMLIQIPVFFGFFGMLGAAVELRNSSFLWVKDLSQPDTIAHFSGIPINILPLLMAGTMFWQMSITPQTGDKMQQRIFMFMPILFLLFCYNYASALALYWSAQNIFSIVQLYLTRNQPMPELKKVATASNISGEKPKRKPPGRPGGRA